jgi:two-component system chemotaxis response regulator CheY
MASTVLVVDDSKTARKVNIAYVRELLGDQVSCLEAAGGEEALSILATQSVDLVLLDLTMPGISGFDVLAEMQRKNMNGLRVVLSADVQRLTRERVIALGAVGFIEKPIKFDALHKVLSTLGLIHADEIFDQDEQDQLAEFVNIAMGRAGSALAEAFAGFVNLRVPEIRTVGAAAIRSIRKNAKTQDAVDWVEF